MTATSLTALVAFLLSVWQVESLSVFTARGLKFQCQRQQGKRVLPYIKYSCSLLCGLVDKAVMFQGLVQGNLTKSQALEVDSVVRRYLDLQVRKY
jgi:hypothetical protein